MMMISVKQFMKSSALLFLIFFSLFSKSQDVESIYNQAKLHYSYHEFDLALEDVNLAIKKKKKYYDAYLLRAAIYADTDKHEKALAELDYVIENFPAPDEAYFKKGMVYFDEEKYEDALLNFDRATELYFQDSEYYYYQGEAAFYLKKMPEACTAWNYGLELDDEDCMEMFNKHCEGVELIEKQTPEFNNPFEKLKKKK